MSNLTILTDSEVSNYVAGLGLLPTTEAYKTFQLLSLLSKDVYVKAISAMAQGLLTFEIIRNLPAMNDVLMERLILGLQGADSLDTLRWNYENNWIPPQYDMTTFKRNAVGTPLNSINSLFVDYWGGVIRPKYDFTKTDETKYHLFEEARTAYMIMLTKDSIRQAYQKFMTYHNALPADVKGADETNIILSIINDVMSKPLFLELSSGARMAHKPLDWLMSRSWIGVGIPNYTRFMRNVLYTKMAELAAGDSARNGKTAANTVFTSYANWVSPRVATYETDFDFARMARIQVPATFLVGQSINNSADVSRVASVIGYLNAAYDAVTEIQFLLSNFMNESAENFRPDEGSPIGILLAITHTQSTLRN